MNNIQASLLAAALVHGGIPDGEVNEVEILKTARKFTTWLDHVDIASGLLKAGALETNTHTCDCITGTVTNWKLFNDTRDPIYVKCNECERWLQPVASRVGDVYLLPTHDRLSDVADTSEEYSPTDPGLSIKR